jgi:transposase
MTEYIGLDVSMKETAVSIRRGVERIWRGKRASDPNIIAELVRKRAPAAKRVVFETGPLSVWSCAARRGIASHLHRCTACQSRSRYGGEQDGCE